MDSPIIYAYVDIFIFYDLLQCCKEPTNKKIILIINHFLRIKLMYMHTHTRVSALKLKKCALKYIFTKISIKKIFEAQFLCNKETKKK